MLKELTEYNPELIDKPRILAITKSDLLDNELQTEMKVGLPKQIPSIFISSVAQKNITELKDLIWSAIQDDGERA